MVIAFVLATILLGMGLTVTGQYRMARTTADRQATDNAMESMAESTLAYLLPVINADGTVPASALEGRSTYVAEPPREEQGCDVTYVANVEHLPVGVLRVTRNAYCEEGMGGEPSSVREIAYALSSDFTSIIDVLDATRSVEDEHPAYDLGIIHGVDIDVDAVGSTHAEVRTTVRLGERSEPGYLRMIVEGPSHSILQRRVAVENRLVPPGERRITLPSFQDYFTLTHQDREENPEMERRVFVLYSPEPFDSGPEARVRWDGCGSPPCGAASVAIASYRASNYIGFHRHEYGD